MPAHVGIAPLFLCCAKALCGKGFCLQSDPHAIFSVVLVAVGLWILFFQAKRC
jgi:hypothetical protein